ncbi:MAG TPA: hypothetical protein ACFYED_00740 [Candidatus Tripitaka californicus]
MKLHVIIEKDEAGYYVAEGWPEVVESRYAFGPSKAIEVVV